MDGPRVAASLAALTDAVNAAVDVALRGQGERLTHAEAAAGSHIDVERLDTLWRAAGLADAGPGVKAIAPSDLELLSLFSLVESVWGEDLTLALLRVVGEAVGRVADTAVSAYRVRFAAPLLADGADAATMAAQVGTLTSAMMPLMVKALDGLLRLHLVGAFRPFEEVIGRDGIETRVVWVGFADVVGSTSLEATLDIAAVARFTRRFETVSASVVLQRGGRIVKWIGDELMFVASDRTTAFDIALALVAAAEHDAALPPLRVGVATGEVACREGDYFGPPVNLAARLVDVAAPGEVIVPLTTCDALDQGIEVRPLGTRYLKGVAPSLELAAIAHSPEHSDSPPET